MFEFNVNVNDLPDSENDFKPLPDGNYDVEIIGAEVKNSAKGGKFLNLKMVVISPEGSGRFLFDIINFENANETAEAIAKQTLKKIMLATGIEQLRTNEDFIGKALTVKVGYKPAKDGYDEGNRIKNYSKMRGAAPAAAPAASESAPWL